MTQVNGRRYDTGESVSIGINDGTIVSVTPINEDEHSLPFIAPGLFDLQINGYGGVWFCSEELTPADVQSVCREYFAHGVTRMFPTLITSSYESLANGFAAIRRAREEHPWVADMVPGCHLEGPYISGEDGPRGAHPRQHVRRPDWDEFRRLQQASGDTIRLITLSPEWDNAPEFIRQAVASGVRVAIGHTAANTEQIAAAIDAGATLGTHLGNGSHGMIRRHPNYIWDQLADDRLTASLITDGHHLPDNVMRVFCRVKGPSRTVITCDASGWAGCTPGQYGEGELAVEVLPTGRIVVAGQTQYLAGSGATTEVCVSTAMRVAGMSLRDAIDSAGRIPAELMGLEEIHLGVGSRADLITFRMREGAELAIERVIAAGQEQFCANGSS